MVADLAFLLYDGVGGNVVDFYQVIAIFLKFLHGLTMSFFVSKLLTEEILSITAGSYQGSYAKPL